MLIFICCIFPGAFSVTPIAHSLSRCQKPTMFLTSKSRTLMKTIVFEKQIYKNPSEPFIQKSCSDVQPQDGHKRHAKASQEPMLAPICLQLGFNFDIILKNLHSFHDFSIIIFAFSIKAHCFVLTTFRVSFGLMTFRVSFGLTTFRVSFGLTTFRVRGLIF